MLHLCQHYLACRFARYDRRCTALFEYNNNQDAGRNQYCTSYRKHAKRIGRKHNLPDKPTSNVGHTHCGGCRTFLALHPDGHQDLAPGSDNASQKEHSQHKKSHIEFQCLSRYIHAWHRQNHLAYRLCEAYIRPWHFS